MYFSAFDDNLGDASAGQVISGPDLRIVLDGVTYEQRNGIVYRIQNGSAVPISDAEGSHLENRQAQTGAKWINIASGRPHVLGVGLPANNGAAAFDTKTLLFLGGGALLLMFLMNRG